MSTAPTLKPHEKREYHALIADVARHLSEPEHLPQTALGTVLIPVLSTRLHDVRGLTSGQPTLAAQVAARLITKLWPLLAMSHAENLDETEQKDPSDGSEQGASEDGDDSSEGDPSGDKPGGGAAEPSPLEQALDEHEEPLLLHTLEAAECLQVIDQLIPGYSSQRSVGLRENIDLNQLLEWTRLIKMLPELRAIADAIGRLHRGRRKQEREHGGGERVVGVHLSGDLHSVLPCDLGLLGSPSTEDLFYQRLIEQRLLSLQLDGLGTDGAPVGDTRGPIVAAVDTSFSMVGPSEVLAKGLILAIAQIALPQKRRFHLILFGAAGELTHLRLSRGPHRLSKLIDFLSRGFSGGTDFNTPLTACMDLIDERDFSRADVLFITDGYGVISPEVRESIASCKAQRGVRFLTAVCSTDPTAVGALKEIFDTVWCLTVNELDAVGLTLTQAGPLWR